jgi:RimJ/RimL family protein N-acetyltransferase
MLFETSRLFVTKWKTGDLDSLYELFDNPAIKEFILPRLTIEETTHIFQTQLTGYDAAFPFGRYFIVKKESLEKIGLFLLKEMKEGIEIGYSLKKEHWNKGFATEIVRESLTWIHELKKFDTVYAITAADNINSQNVLIKSGFSLQENFVEDGKEMSLFQKDT